MSSEKLEESDGAIPAGADGSDADASTARVRDALAEVRREVRKAAAVYAVVDAALVALAANLLLSLFTPAALDAYLGLPGVAYAALRSVPLIGDVAPRAVQATSLVAVALGLATFAAEYLLRLREPLVEQFEAANPEVREALRTARDAVGDRSETPMARRLYDDVIARLESTSTGELVATRRVAVTVLLVVVVSLASVQVALVNPDLGGLLGPDDGAGIEQPEDDDLQDGDRILGDSEDVQAGDDLENITVTGSGEPIGDGATAPGGDGYGSGGGSGEFESQQAGFAGSERIEDAELVREYNLRIREIDDEETDT
ncbi:DUF7502 family protein [Halobellus rubicundus]|uniref:AI-2E family transporter n=1 Tax=Halobellus rubicundus TaxID=2996466 RepID=A0ABD5MDH3_9EURY